MANFLLGFKALFRAWSDPTFAELLQPLVEDQLPAPAPAPPPPAPTPAPAAAPARSDALALLSVLQREGRLLDFLKEPVDGYSDADVGAAVRGLHKECGAALERLFGLQPLLPQAEGSTVEAPAGYDPAQYRIVGGGAGTRGVLAHPGWKAMRCELPAWTGRPESALVLAPAEIEVK